MSVEDWARREASALIGDRIEDAKERVRFVDGVTVLADALLSEEAVEAAARQGHTNAGVGRGAWGTWESVSPEDADVYRAEARAALQAAVRAATEGESE